MQNSFQNHTSHIKQLNNQKLFSQIKQLSNEKLLSQTKLLVQKERDVHIQILTHLAEIDSRKLFFRRGFSSLFDYAVRELGYSEGAAYRRIKAMKLCQDMPETENRLQSGHLSLSTACQLQVFFERQGRKVREEKKKALLLKTSEERVASIEKEEQRKRIVGAEFHSPERELEEQVMGEKVTSPAKEGLKAKIIEKKVNINCQSLSQEEKEDLVKKVEGCSRRATEKLLAERDPSLSLSQEKTRFLGKGKVEIKITIDEECYKRLEELKNLLSHKNPALSYGKLLSILSEEGLKKHDPRKKSIRQRDQKTQTKVSPAKLELKNQKKEQIATSAKKEVQEIKKEAEGAFTSAKKQIQKNPTKHQIKKISRTIPSWLKKYIWKRDGGRCNYTDPKTKRCCSSKHLLQIDHIRPFAMGGKTEKENLRLLCAGHNQYRR